MAQFGDMLSELRKDHNLTQQELGDIIFVTNGTISNYEKNNFIPAVDKIIMLADYFDVTVDYLLGRSTCNLSPSVLNEEIISGCTVGAFVRDYKCLDLERRRILSGIMQDMKMAAIVHQFNEKGKK